MNWNAKRFLKELQKNCGTNHAIIARDILKWSIENQFDITFGKGNIDGSFAPCFVYNGKNHPLFSVKTYGKIELNFQYYTKYPPFDREEKRIELWRELNGILDEQIPIKKIDKLPKIPILELENEQIFKEFIGIFEWFVQEIKTRSSNIKVSEEVD